MLVDFSLIEKARQGDGAAFNQVVLAYRKRTMGTIIRLIGRPEDVEDVAQEVFVRLFLCLEQLRAPELFEPWLYRLTVNAAYDYLRKRKRRQESRMSDLGDQQVVMADAAAGERVEADRLEAAEIREFVQCLLAEMSEEDRILLMFEGSRGPLAQRARAGLQRE